VGAGLPAPPPHDARTLRLQRSSWIRLAVAVALALGAIALFPQTGGDAPPLASLALIGTVVAGVTTAALYAIVRWDLRLPGRTATALAIAFALIGLVKFVLAPFGLYEVNALRALDDYISTVGDLGGTVITAATVFGLYALGYTIAYRVGRPADRGRRRVRGGDGRRIRARTILAILLVAGLLAVSGLWLVVLLLVNTPRQYLEFVFSSGAGVLMAIALAAAATLIGSVFRAVGRRPDLVADVGSVVALFWLGLGFLALYHVLWIVYVLVLASIWPLRTVVP
jgi:hypothetical protein